MKTENKINNEPKINKSNFARFKEIGKQSYEENKIVITKLEHTKLKKELFLTSYNSLYKTVDAIVLSNKGLSHETIKIEDIEKDTNLKRAIDFKEATLKELELLPESPTKEILHEFVKWAGNTKDKEADKQEKQEVTDDKNNKKSEQVKQFEVMRNENVKHEIER
ncbi:MAG: hypothetical protein U0U67_09130 [Chitinophagales bacterium]